MSNSTETPRIYVACLACYNDGKLHGVWIDAERAEMQQECGHTDHDWAIHDHEGFQGYKLGEYESFSDVSKLAGLLETHGSAFAAFLANGSADLSDDDVEDRFQEAYAGTWRNLEAYAEDYLESTGMLREVPEFLRNYIDVEAFARDLELGGDVWTAESDDYQVHVFHNY